MECLNDSAILALLRRANSCFSGFFESFSGAPVAGPEEELRALLHLHEVLELVGALLDGRLQSATNREVREALGFYRENLIQLRSALAIMEGSAIACRARLDSQRQHLYGAKAWCAAARTLS